MQHSLKIGNVTAPLPQPAYGDGYTWHSESLDASSGTGRNKLTGEAFRQKIATKRTVDIKYSALKPQQIQAILDELDVENVSKKWLSCELLNPRTGQLYSGTFYCASYQVSLNSNSEKSGPVWTGLSFTLVEQ